MQPLRTALIGCGNWGGKLARNLADLPAFRFVTACDAAGDRAEELARRHGIERAATDPGAVFGSGDVEAAVIATPAPTHAPLVRAALEAGLHVLCEKPLALSAAAGGELLERAAVAGRVLLADHTELYSGPFREVAARVASGELGAIRSIELEHVNRVPGPPDVDLLWDLAPHDFAMLDVLAGDGPAEVEAEAEAGSDGLRLRLRYASGAAAVVRLARGAAARRRTLAVRGDRGVLRCDGFGPGDVVRLTRNGGGDVREVAIPCDGTEPLRRLCGAFAARARGGGVGGNGVRELGVLERLESAAAALGGRPGEPRAAGRVTDC